MLRKDVMLRAVVLGLLVLPGAGCKDEPAAPADPLDDPWVDGLDEELAADEPVEAAPAPIEGAPENAAPPTANAEPAEPAAVPAAANPPTDKPVDDQPLAKAPAKGKRSTAKKSPDPSTPEVAESTEAPSEPSQPEPSPDPTPAPAVEPAPTPTPVTPPTPPPLTVADFGGKYRYVGGERQRKALEQAIEGAAQELSLVIRKIGRKRLTETNPIDPGLELVVTGDRVKTIFSKSGFDAECTVDGPTVSYTSKKGKKLKVRIRQSKNKLVQSISDSDGMKTTVFVLSKDRKRLTVHHKVTADRLDSPMTYKLSYARQ